MRKAMEAYAAFRAGQDAARPTMNQGAFFFRRRITEKQPPKTRGYDPLRAFVAIRTAQDEARPEGNFGAFFFKRRLYG